MSRLDWGSWGIRGAALALASLLWLYAVTEHRYERELEIRLQIDEPALAAQQSREVVVANQPPGRVRIRVSGTGKDLLQTHSDDFVMRVRPEGGPGSSRSYRLTPAMVEQRQTGPGVAVEEVTAPREIDVALDWRTEREVPVRACADIAAADAHVQVGDLEIVPATVRVSGPSRQVSRIEQIETDSLRLRGVEDDVDRLVGLRVPAAMRLVLTPPEVRLHANIQTIAQHTFAQVPIQVRHAEECSLAPSPASVRVDVRGGWKVVAALEPKRHLLLYIDCREYNGEPLTVRYDQNPLFEITQITPARVDLVAR